ncbi:MAG: T9SS type A sorting domain-containing protein [Bacteroidales bacterium]|nr:T9SS type A sorting domain-containing protein [Bacteroidales bacterium]
MQEGSIQKISSNFIYTFDYTPMQPDQRFLIHFSNPLGLDEYNYGDMVIYSHRDMIYVKSSNKEKKEVVVYNIMGQEIIKQFISDAGICRIKISNETGYYLVKVQTEGNLITRKVFIK